MPTMRDHSTQNCYQLTQPVRPPSPAIIYTINL